MNVTRIIYYVILTKHNSFTFEFFFQICQSFCDFEEKMYHLNAFTSLFGVWISWMWNKIILFIFFSW